MTNATASTTGNDTIELFAAYAQHCVDGMDIADLMNDQNISIVRRLEDLPKIDAIIEIEESAYATELADAIDEVADNADADTTELFDQYAQRCVEDIDTGDLENAVKGNIEERLEDLPFIDAISEIEQSAYAEALADKLHIATADAPNKIIQLISAYADVCVDDMGHDDLRIYKKSTIVRRLESVPQVDALQEISESVHADKLSSALAIVTVIAGADTTDLFDQYAQCCVVDIVDDNLEAVVKATIHEVLGSMSFLEAINEIENSAYAKELAEKLAVAHDEICPPAP